MPKILFKKLEKCYILYLCACPYALLKNVYPLQNKKKTNRPSWKTKLGRGECKSTERFTLHKVHTSSDRQMDERYSSLIGIKFHDSFTILNKTILIHLFHSYSEYATHAPFVIGDAVFFFFSILILKCRLYSRFFFRKKHLHPEWWKAHTLFVKLWNLHQPGAEAHQAMRPSKLEAVGDHARHHKMGADTNKYLSSCVIFLGFRLTILLFRTL